MRKRGFEDGVLGLSHGHLSLLRQDTNANIRAAAIAMSVGRNGGIVSFETQADRDDASRPDVFWTFIFCFLSLSTALRKRRVVSLASDFMTTMILPFPLMDWDLSLICIHWPGRR